MKERILRWRRRSFHDKALIATNYMTGTTAVLAACSMDGSSLFPFIMFILCSGWLSLFAYANGYIE